MSTPGRLPRPLSLASTPTLAALALAAAASLAAAAPGQDAPPEKAQAYRSPGAVPAPADTAKNPYGRKYLTRVYTTQRLAGRPPSIDGRLDDGAWKEGEWAGDYVQNLPVEGARPTSPTELKILYDDRNLYVAIRAYDDPAKVIRYPGNRDDFGDYAVDIVGVCFNSYDDKRTGFEFDLTSGGGKIDLVLGNGETEWDTSWNAVWDGKVAHDEKGWTAEMRIPFNQLRFGPKDEQVWGMHAWRWISRNQEEDQWQLIPRQNTGRMYQLGELHGIRGLRRARHLELLPHVLGKAASGPSTPGEGSDGSGSMGLDAKLGLSSNFTLDATVNPDFGQVEADPSVVNLTAYETFYEEKRPFFLEGRKIFNFGIEDSDVLFYSRRIGHAPSYTPAAAPGETLRMPDSTTILTAAKVTGKTDGGLEVGVLQSLTQKERATIAPLQRQPIVEPFGSYTVARVHKDWDKGNTALGGMLTDTHRSLSDAVLASSDSGLSFLPANAITGGLDFSRYFANRKWVLEGSGVFSNVSGEPAAILALQTNAVHYYQRTGATHLGVDPNRTSLFGHGGSLAGGTSGTGRLRLTDHFHWYSPGLDLNDVGYLRQADVLANQAFLGWVESVPKGIFRSYSFQLSREDDWDFGGLQTKGSTELEASTTFANKWGATANASFNQEVDTRALRGGPALRAPDYWSAHLGVNSDSARQISGSLTGGGLWSVEDDTSIASVTGSVRFRLSDRLALYGTARREALHDNLQYVTTASAAGDPRYVLGRIEQHTWELTLRANLQLLPDLTLQLYASPFLSTGRYGSFKRATDTLSPTWAARFHAYGGDEIAYLPGSKAYSVTEAGGASYSFADPDFSFRQFRSNLVLRYEWKPGSTVYVVWSQGRTGAEDFAESRFGRNWSGLWQTRADNVFLVKLSYWFSP